MTILELQILSAPVQNTCRTKYALNPCVRRGRSF